MPLPAAMPGGSGGGEVSEHAPHRSEGFDGGPGHWGCREGCDATCDSASCAPKGFLKRTLTIEVSSFVLEF